MIGNAVPVEFAKKLAIRIKMDLAGWDKIVLKSRARGQVFSFEELEEQEISA